jgi:hypothetical protein
MEGYLSVSPLRSILYSDIDVRDEVVRISASEYEHLNGVISFGLLDE